DDWARIWMETTGTEKHLEKLKKSTFKGADSEEDIYKANDLPYMIPELREGRSEFELSKKAIKGIIDFDELKGCIHNHSTWSDGGRTIEEMAIACRERGLEYFGIADHSKSAFYAGGMQANRVPAQWKEVDKLNDKLAPFRIFKGIESDILKDGSLDYDDDLLAGFDYVVASIHSGFNMTEKEATTRLINAIENPYTTVLGHMSGRKLLNRAGYPINHKQVIDACADNGVVIEINSNPLRLDVDWQWLHYAQERGVTISINPDAHSIPEIDFMRYGVMMARKGGIQKENVLNTLPLAEIERFFEARKQKRN
ncbi:MAG: PHP domain-containing protein, partial [Bacteroidota bacterium]|nr:PHP domain-containing protein [Bacteroidota bacterium]